ncbi:MAG: aromatic ring-hydroxylating dioxygenase subunit alpha [Nevskia sp.]|nr:aromatic ring-hydroxylating dioxygenase subunit alpha [Nevskia sp.]
MSTSDYLNNAWYAAAWSSEVGRALLERTILEQPVLLYRKEDGAPVAIGNRCAHRFAPLGMGKLIGDTVQCRYHGLRYDGTGRCVLNPHADGMIPPRMAVPSYTLAEKHGLIWLWMGDPHKADADTIPDFSCHTDPALAFVGGVIEMKANYQLITDNLLDLAHGEFVHEGVLSSEAITRSRLQTIEQGTTIYSNRWMPSGEAIPAFAMIFDGHRPGQPVDQWAYMRWDAPAHMLLDVGITAVGQSRGEGAWIYGTDILTPKDTCSTYYFWGITRGYKIDDPAAGMLWREVIKQAFEGQDQVIIEAQQRMLGAQSLEQAGPVMFASDAAAQRARKRLAELVRKDAVPAPQNPDLSALRQRGAQSRSPILPAV